MYRPHIQKVCSHLTPWELFQSIYSQSSHCFFLDSHEYVPPNQTYSYIGFDPILTLKLDAKKLRLNGIEKKSYPTRDFMKVMRRLMKKYNYRNVAKRSYLTGGVIGLWSYELTALFEKSALQGRHVLEVPLALLGFYHNLIVFDHQKQVYFFVIHVKSKGEAVGDDEKKQARTKLSVLKRILNQAEQAWDQNPLKRTSFSLKHFRPNVPKANFLKMVQKAKSYIRSGDIYQANLSQRFSFQFKGSPLELYDQLRGINPSPFSSFFKMGEIEVVSSSPERLIQKRGQDCETLPIAGTRPRGRKSRTEQKMMRELLMNEKERAEHIMLVDLERNDLGRVCEASSVKVSEMMRIEKYSHVIHLVSKVVGKLKKNKDVFDLVAAMFPGGTITGCPKIRCMQIIEELEPSARGVYTGSLGYIDFHGDMDLNIVIRTLVLQKNKGSFQVGAGIVYDSDPSKEYQETLHKGQALVEALGSPEPVKK